MDMDYERTSAPHDSPPPSPPRSSPLDPLVRLRLRVRGGVLASVLMGAGAAALIYALGSALVTALNLDNGLGAEIFGTLPGRADTVVLLLSDAVGGLTLGVLARRHTLLLAAGTALILRLPRLFIALRALIAVLPSLDLSRGRLVDAILNGSGLVPLSIILWLITATLGGLLAERRLDGLGLR